jgi:hypothetical protein
VTIAALRRIQDEAELTTAQLLENVEHLLSNCTPEVIAARLGMEMDAIEKRCYRNGRLDLAAPFNNVVQTQRRLLSSVADLVHRGDHVQVHLGQEMPVTVVGGADAGVPEPA